MLCLLGGLTGIALGIGAAIAIAELFGWPIFISPAGDRDRLRFRRRRRDVLRLLSGAQGIAPRPDRGAALRVDTVAPARS